MSYLVSPQQLVDNSRRIHSENLVRVKRYLNEALNKLVLAPGQTRVEKLLLVRAKRGDIDLILHLMMEAGYLTVNVIERPAGRNEIDIVMEFTIPPQAE